MTDDELRALGYQQNEESPHRWFKGMGNGVVSSVIRGDNGYFKVEVSGNTQYVNLKDIVAKIG